MIMLTCCTKNDCIIDIGTNKESRQEAHQYIGNKSAKEMILPQLFALQMTEGISAKYGS